MYCVCHSYQGQRYWGKRGPHYLAGTLTLLYRNWGADSAFLLLFCTPNFLDLPPSLTITNRAHGVYFAGPDMLWGWLGGCSQSSCFLRKPRKLMKSSPSIWHHIVSVKWTVNISSIFVAFLENTNFQDEA